MKQVFMVASAFVVLAISVCGAQENPVPARPNNGTNSLRAQADTGSCVEVEIGGERSAAIDCLNRRLRQQVDRVQPSLPRPDFDATSSDTRIGVANQPAVQQQYGKNYGVSPYPQRPAAPSFVNRR